ncbi:MAG: hypothetical protein AAF909_14650 [Pseudomonadota bacterium]
MRATMFAILAALSLSGCGGLATSDLAGPPEWFLRAEERAQLSAARVSAQAGPAQMLHVVTPLGPAPFAARLAQRIEGCWLAGERSWAVRRVGPASAATASLELVDLDAPSAPALRLEIRAAAAPGLTVSARGPLASDDHRDRLRRALNRAGGAASSKAAPGGGADAALNCF